MSRLGKKPIPIPENTEVTVEEDFVNVKGPKGELKLAYKPFVNISVENGEVILSPKGENVEHRSLWGTYSSEIKSMIEGVNNPFQKKLIIEGVGYRAEMRGNTIVLNIGFSHSVELEIPEGVSCEVEKNSISISGISKEKVGQFAAIIRSKKKPEPYKGKGIRYEGEVVRRKEGKKAV